MTGAEFIELFRSAPSVLPVVQFTHEVESWEGYFDEKMIARCVSIEHDMDDIYKFTFHCAEWDKHNTLVEKHNYYDHHGNPCLDAREAHCHPETSGWKESLWFDMESTIPFLVLRNM